MPRERERERERDEPRCKLKQTTLAWRLSEADHHSGQSGQQMMMEGEPGEREQEILAVEDHGGSAVCRE